MQSLMSLNAQRLDLVFGGVLQRFRRGDMVGNDFDHIHIRNELVQQAFERNQRAADGGHRTGHLNVVAAGHLRQRGQEGGDVQFGQIHGAEFLDDHVQISQQCWVVLRIGLGAGKSQQPLGQSGRILFGDGENHFFEDCTGALVEPTGHTEVDKYDLAAPDDDIAGMWVSVEEAVVENLRGVIVDELGADLLQVITGVGDGDAVDVLHDHHMLGAQFGVRRRAVHVFESGGETLEFGEVAGLDQKVSLRFEGVPQLLDHALQVHDL